MPVPGLTAGVNRLKTNEIDTTGLRYVDGYDFPVYASSIDVARARRMADRMARTLSWLEGMVPMPATPSLFVLNPTDWQRIALVPQYGLPHCNRSRIVVGQETSGLWGDLVSLVWPHLRWIDRRRLRRVYGSPPDVTSFVDLLISHELTHLADRPAHLDGFDQHRGWGAVPRVLWFVELFANVGLQGYVQECEPDRLRRLETLFQAIGATQEDFWPMNSLTQMYSALKFADTNGFNYCWYEFRLQIVAKRLWAAGGSAGFKRIHQVLHGPLLTDFELMEVIASIDGTAANAIRRWSLKPST